MKKFLLAIIICMFVVFASHELNYYDMNGIVYADEGNALVLLDNTGNLWEIDYTDTLKVGDKVKITFYTNSTDSERIDDEIAAVIKKD